MQPLPTVPQNCRQTLVFKVGPTAAEHTVHFHSVLHHRKWVVIHLKVNAASILWIVKLPFPRVRLLTIEEFYFRFELSFSFSSSLSVKFILSWFYSSAFLIFLCVMTGADICTDVTKKKLFSNALSSLIPKTRSWDTLFTIFPQIKTTFNCSGGIRLGKEHFSRRRWTTIPAP